MVKQDVNVNVEKQNDVYSMFSPAADDDPAELEKEELTRLIKKLIIKGKGISEDKRESSYGIQGTQLTDEYYKLKELKVKYKDFILTNKTVIFGEQPYSPEVQTFLNSVDKNWRTGGRRRTRNRRRKYKSKRV